jgi:septin family protein
MRDWTARHPDYQTYRNTKVRTWAAARNYWKQYRASHPEYVRKDNKRRVRARKRLKVSAKQTTIRQITVNKLNSIRKNEPVLSAKQTAIDRRMDSLINLLIWKELSAKQTDIASITGSVP